MTGYDGAYFQVGLSTGALTLAKSVDHLPQINYTVIIQAADNATFPKASTVSVTITTISVNKFAPVFTNSASPVLARC